MKRLTCLVIFCLMPPGVHHARAQDADQLRSFVESWCLDCHSGERPKAKLDLEAFVQGDPLARDGKTLKKIRDMLGLGEMPPEDEPRPGFQQIAEVLVLIDHTLAEQKRAGANADARPGTALDVGRVTMRRLNRVEYENSIRDLLGVDFDAASFLPADDVGYGFDSIGDVLSMPPLLFEKYIDAAERIAAEAFPDPLPDTPVIRAIDGSDLRGEGRGMRTQGRGHYLSSTGIVFTNHQFPITGLYRLHVEAGGQQAGPENVKVQFILGSERLDVVEIPDTYDDPGHYWIEVTVIAGAHRVGVAFVNDYYRPEHPDPRQRDRNCGIFGLKIEGPLDLPPRAPREEREATLRDRDPLSWVRTTIRDLASRIYRRPVARADLADLIDLAGNEGTPESRVRMALTGMLVSPRFLFRPEPSSGETRDLDGYELATRLAYFLWSSTPDAPLLQAAGRGVLDTPDGLIAETRRLLRDPRSLALAQNFATQWLQVRDLERRRPDPAQFPGVDQALLASMKAETILLFDALMREDRPALELVSTDFTFLDERLAAHYGVPGVRGDYMRRVRLPAGMSGGVISHASVLTATSNPARTSPVKRGKWVLEVLLDAPPPPPPPGVVSFEEARLQTGGATPREILARHRTDPNCSVCHRRMDALGFALEQYDAVGRYRETIGGLPVDSMGELPDGRILNGADDLRELLLKETGFQRSLARHLLTFALGRGVTDADDPVLDSLLQSMEREGTIGGLVRAIVRSDSFRRGGRGRDQK